MNDILVGIVRDLRALQQRIEDTGTQDTGVMRRSGLSIANNATGEPFGTVATLNGLLIVIDTSASNAAVFILAGGVSVLVSQTGTIFSATATTAAKINVYYSANIITVENKTGGTKVVSARLV